MLTIRIAQLEALRAGLLPAVVARTATYLRTHHATAARHLSDAALEAEVARSIGRATSHGLTWESSLACFAAFALEIGPAFDEHPRIAAALSDEALLPDERFAAMLDTTTEADWQDARALGVAQRTDPFKLTPVNPAFGEPLADLLEDLGPAAPLPPDGVASWIARTVRARAVGREVAFVLTTHADAAMGVVAVVGVDRLGGHAELTYWVGRAYQGRGRATAAARRIVAFGFQRLRLAMIEATVAPQNAASRRVLDKLGARRTPYRDPRDGGAAMTYRFQEEQWRGTTD